MTTEATIAQAIARSVSHTEIVHLDYSPELAAELALVAEDSAITGTEFWGTDAEGNEWRVHLDR